jgi:hypothetical protein
VDSLRRPSTARSKLGTRSLPVSVAAVWALPLLGLLSIVLFKAGRSTAWLRRLSLARTRPPGFFSVSGSSKSGSRRTPRPDSSGGGGGSAQPNRQAPPLVRESLDLERASRGRAVTLTRCYDAGRSVRPCRCALAYPEAASRRLRSSRVQGPLTCLRASLVPMSHRERTSDSLRNRLGGAHKDRSSRRGSWSIHQTGSAAATQTMRDPGFTHVVDGGGLSELGEAGAPVSPDLARHGSRDCRSGLSPTAVMMER